ncbi:MAG: RNA polymerase sigma factor FliA [Burkholderiales bacterium]
MYTATGQIDREDYIERFAPLVKRMASHLLAKLPASVEADDIIQAGLIGLMDAASRFEEGQGVQFETYATQRIRGAMLDELRASDWLPRSLRKSQREIERTISKLEQRLKRPPLETEIAKEIGVPLHEYQTMLQDARCHQLLYLEDFSDDDDSGSDSFLDRNCPDNRSDPVEAIQDRRFRVALVDAIDGLPERERLLMGLYYEQELNFREIAAVLGVTESRICQLHSQAVSRLRSKMKEW